jgi:hypothetical protein
VNVEPGQLWEDCRGTENLRGTQDWKPETHGSWLVTGLTIVRPAPPREGDWIGRDPQGVEWTMRREHFASGAYRLIS